MASLWIGRHDPVLRFDLQQREVWIEGLDAKRHAAMERWILGLSEQFNSPLTHSPPQTPAYSLGPPQRQEGLCQGRRAHP